MGNGNNPSIKADLFSARQSPDISSPSASEAKSSPLRTDEPAAASSQSYVLPTNLPSALRYLDDDQLDRLLAAVLSELKQRGKKLSVSDEKLRKPLVQEVAAPLALGKLNAVRAAFKAGVTPSRIARQFRISQSEVKKALASDPKEVRTRARLPPRKTSADEERATADVQRKLCRNWLIYIMTSSSVRTRTKDVIAATARTSGG